VLVHCNSFVDGYWTDITRTYCLGEPGEDRRRMYDAVFAARDAALDAIRVGARASEIDAVARGELRARGFGDAFKHPTGHGVGFAAIDHGARPMLHPRSTDVLERGMVFNVEPGIYLDGEAGLRHCDVVALEEDGPRVLTPFHDDVDALALVHAPAGGRT
jgi:Xaa-Pro dipeptidase